MTIEELYKKISGDDLSTVKHKNYDDVEERIRKEELRKLELQNESLEGENKGDAQDREQRKDFAD